MGEDLKPRHFDLTPETVLPWMYDSGLAQNTIEDCGSYGKVNPFKIYPECHNFTPLLEKVRASNIQIPGSMTSTKDVYIAGANF
jgi:hypothetical protein